MERLQRVLGRRTGDLVALLERQRGFSHDEAERFVALAGNDLIESFQWQDEELDPCDLSTTPNVQRLLGGIHANRIASSLEVAPAEVWESLRTFVPAVLRWANGRTNGRNGRAHYA